MEGGRKGMPFDRLRVSGYGMGGTARSLRAPAAVAAVATPLRVWSDRRAAGAMASIFARLTELSIGPNNRVRPLNQGGALSTVALDVGVVKGIDHKILW